MIWTLLDLLVFHLKQSTKTIHVVFVYFVAWTSKRLVVLLVS